MLGLVIAHFGVTLFLISSLGADPFNVFVQGIYRTIESKLPEDLLSNGFLTQELPIWGRGLMLVFGCIILAYGMTIVIKSDTGTGPNDLVAVVISDKTKLKFSIIRLCIDGVFALIGFLLGGILGVGTLVCIALVGPVAGLFMPINEKAVNSLVTKAIAQKN